MNNTDPVSLLQALIRCPSVTPHDAGALDVVQAVAESLGFQIERPRFHAEATPDIENLYARMGTGGPHLMFAGHTDVVPVGDEENWRHPPFSGEIAEGILYGRGAVDMKGGIAAFLAALARVLERQPITGSVSLLITGDEEGPAINGSVKLLKWAVERGETWDGAIVGEPTNPEQLGDMVKIGRRGSLSAVLSVKGQQGHVAYPHLADNPLPSLLILLDSLVSVPLDEGSADFQPSNLELTSIDTGNNATNIIPGKTTACFNIRFNDHWSVAALQAEIMSRLTAVEHRNGKAVDFEIEWLANPADVFLTRNEKLIKSVCDAIAQVSGKVPQLSTSGGTSDARFIKDYCPVVEFGLVGQTMHKVDECVPISELEELTEIYEALIEKFFA